MARTKGILFDNRSNFRLEDAAWHQPRCREEWLGCCDLYAKKVKQTEAATRARPKNVT